MRRILEEIWKPFDETDGLDSALLTFGYIMLTIIILGVV